VRRDAIAALVDLAHQERSAPPVRTRGAIRVRRAQVRPRRELSSKASDVLAVLQRISDDRSEKAYLRRKAEAGASALA
jgi:hypothetical protein